jgi:hypothetical protein
MPIYWPMSTSPLEVSDWDWNESYVEMSGTIGLDVSIEITFKPESKEEPMLEVREASNQKNTLATLATDLNS